MNPLLITLGLRAFKLVLGIPDLRAKLNETVNREAPDVSPQVIDALSGNADAIKLLSDELDEAIETNKGIVARLERRAERE